ncbi:EamA family transporter [Rhizobium sp. BE258]|jgi:drug/metabolite transporter (DMT)-like permease|uniref:EamA family transporter n=1 Tax=Rhizobium sp. BE258 TaxID=2817722 RepID=UPI0028591C24|nr:EamA family transporter [Rhizobium sp. BE258]MDR7147596.1 drug/metabolite transporter (DMT)-like permease [Rhizobium sp. BE258]
MSAIRPVWLAVPLLNTAQQILLKRSAEEAGGGHGEWLVQILSSHWFLAAIVAEVACFVIWMTVLSELDVSKAFPLSAISYVFIMSIAWFVFGEPLPLLQLAGSGLILIGIWCIATAAPAD